MIVILSFKLKSYVQQVQEENVTVIIQCCDIESSCCSNKYLESDVSKKADISENELSYSPRLMLRVGESMYGGEYEERSGKCAICIEDFSVGDFIVGSINHRECPHVYHFDCILSWFSKSTTGCGHYYCPVCRQLFMMDE